MAVSRSLSARPPPGRLLPFAPLHRPVLLVLTAQVAGWQDMPEEQQSVLLNPGWPSSMRDNMKPTAEQFENFVAGNGARL